MSAGAISLIVVMVVGLFAGVPIAWALIIASASAIVIEGIPIAVLVQRLFTSMDAFTMLAVPCFLVAGDIMSKGSISRRLVEFANSFFGTLRGGLGVVAIMSATVFASLTGSSIATTAAIGGIMCPEMTAKNYPREFSAAVVAMGGTLGPIIPPSVIFIFYAQASELSIVRLFLSSVFPGLIASFSMIAWILYIAKKRNYPKEGSISLKKILVSTKGAVFALIMPLIILGGIYLGVFTATESAAVAVMYGIVVSMILYRDVGIKDMFNMFKGTARTIANLMVLIAAANLFGYLIGYFNIPRILTATVMKYAPNTFWFMLLCGIMLTIAGMFVESLALTVIAAPILHPMALSYGVDPIHFACFAVFLMNLGMATPPFAPLAFIASDIAEVPVLKVFREVIPYIILQLGVAVLIAMIPSLSTWLPSTMR